VAEEQEATPAEQPETEAEPSADGGATADAPAPADPLAGGTDALLSMFVETKTEGEDKSALLELAGDVPIDGLLDDLRTLQSAIRLRMEETAAAK
jgi:hypothetical protein